MSWRIARRGDVAGARAALPRRGGAGRCALKPRPPRADARGDGCRRPRPRPRRAPHARDAARAGTRARGACVGRWALGCGRVAAALLLPPCGSIAALAHARPDADAAAPALRGRRRRRRRPRARAATCSCSRCTRWPASPASSPAARCRCRPSATRASRAGCTSTAGPLAIAFVVGATSSRSAPRPTSLGHTPPTLSRPAARLARPAAARAAAARAPRADRAVPAAGRLDHRQPPRRSGSELLAATFVTVGDRRAGARRRRVRRGLRLAAPAARRVLRSALRRLTGSCNARLARDRTSLCIVWVRTFRRTTTRSTTWQATSPTSPTTTSRPRSSSPTSPCSSTSGRRGAARAASSPRCSRRSPPSATTCAIVKLNVDENQQTAAQFEVLSIPTMILFKDGQAAKKIVGAQPRPRIESALDSVLVA